jgi:integrase
MMTMTPTSEEIMASTPTPLSLRKHHAHRSWTTDWYDDHGHRRMKRFGKEGEVSVKEARARYQNWLGAEFSKEEIKNPQGEAAKYTVDQLCDDYWAFAQQHYVKAGKPTSFLSQVKCALDRLRAAYGSRRTCDVEAPMIASLRDEMIDSVPDGDGGTRPLARGTVNDRLHIIKQAFSWAHAEKGKVSQQVAWSISQVRPLGQGRSRAVEPEPVPPIADAEVAAMLRACTRTLADMIRLQRLCGARPQEVCIIRGCDIEAGGDVWLYRPGRHKTEHHNKQRVIPIGKRGQRIIKRRLRTDLQAYLFTPAMALAETAGKLGQRMGTRVGKTYTTRSYRQAIHRACKRAKIDPWNPNQIRHAWATEVRKMFGIEAVAAGLGHSDIKMAETYAERDIEKAKEVARKVG